MKARAMIIDDDPFLVGFLQVWFESNGIDVFVCNNPLIASQEVSGVDPDFIVIDVYMNGISGFDVARSLKKNHETADIPIMFISGSMDSETAEAAFMVGAMDVMKKPIDVNELLEKARPLIDFHRVHKMIKEITH